MPRITRKNRRAKRVLTRDEQHLMTLAISCLENAAEKVFYSQESCERFRAVKKLLEELRELHS